MADETRGSKELVLAPFTYAFMQDTTKGQVKIFTGPTVINQTAQEVPVIYNSATGSFERCRTLEEAVRKSPVAVEGFYMVLYNPSKDGSQPEEGLAGKPSPALNVGRRVNLPGPATFPLWPGQAAYSVRGHHLRSNQYLLVRVYNDEEARKNWSKAIVKPAEGLEDSDVTAVSKGAPSDLTVGKLFIIKGTEVSFYIPPTGVTVVKADPEGSSVADEGFGFVRDALTLEQLEYCVLVDENGSKRYEHGPQVVFPEPTERFLGDNKGQIKARAIELNEIQGIHIKVIEDYVDEEDGKEHKKGDELFLTGKDVQIYFPREEHSLITYDGRSKHFATAIPSGEGRYVMNRLTGDITTHRGPKMLLPDPRHEVIVRRALSLKQCGFWYPGNQEAIEYNLALTEVVQNAPTTRSGAVSEGDFERSAGKNLRKRGFVSSALMDKSLHGDGGGNIQGDAFTRASTYTQPRTVTLNTKFQGVPAIDIWTGYAILIVSKTGKRRVVEGPNTVLLDYDEALTVLELSSGKPKTTDHLIKTTYLQVKNNKVSDLITLETSDHVKVSAKLSYRCHFEGDSEKWFDVVNYVKFFTDHIRSVLKAAIKKQKVSDFYPMAAEVIRDTILGAKTEAGRPGMSFPEIGLVIDDVEALAIFIEDKEVQSLFDSAQRNVVRGNIEAEGARQSLVWSKQIMEVDVERERISASATAEISELKRDTIAQQLATDLARILAEVQKVDKNRLIVESKLSTTDLEHSSALARHDEKRKQELAHQKAEDDLRIASLVAETEATVARFDAAQGGFSEALLALSNADVLEKVAKSISVQSMVGGESFVDVIQKIFAGSAMAGTMAAIAEKASAVIPSNGKVKRSSVTPTPA